MTSDDAQTVRSEREMREELIAQYLEEARREAVRFVLDVDKWDIEGMKVLWAAAPNKAELRWRRRQCQIPAAVRREILLDDCDYCGDVATTVDHVLPVSRGGTRDRDNLAPACSSCNWNKLDFTPDEWRAWRIERGYRWPPLAWTERVAESVEAVASRG